MKTTIEAMKQALEVLELNYCGEAAQKDLNDAIDREEAQSVEVEPCGCCGEVDADKRCVGCLHPFSNHALAKQPLPAEREALISRYIELNNANYTDDDVRGLGEWAGDAYDMLAADAQPPQAAPRVPMTRDQVDDLAEDGCFLGNVYEITAAIEAHHGICEVKP